MGKIFLFVIIATIGLFALLLLGNSASQNQSTVIPTIPPLIPTPTPTTTPTPTPTVNIKKEASVNAEQIIQYMATRSATIITTKGDITLSFHAHDAPNTVYNFLVKAKNGFYNNLIFHRVEDWVIQGGDPKGDGTGGGTMTTEINGKPFVAGSLGMARGKDIRITNDAQFFIVKKDADWLYTQYANFGMVTKGMDVVNNLQAGDKILGITIE